MRNPSLRHGCRPVVAKASATRTALPLLMLLITAGGCAGTPEVRRGAGADDARMASAAALAQRLPPELLGMRRNATESFVLPRLGSGLAVRYAPDTGGALASVVLVARSESGIAGDDPRQPAATEEFGHMLAETLGLAHPAISPRGTSAVPEEQFIVALRGQPLVRCATLAEATEDGRRLNGLRCLGVARARFVRVFLTAAPGAMGLREAAGFAALVTVLLQEDDTGRGDAGTRTGAPAGDGSTAPDLGPSEPPRAPGRGPGLPSPQGRRPVYRT